MEDKNEMLPEICKICMFLRRALAARKIVGSRRSSRNWEWSGEEGEKDEPEE